MGMPSRLRTQVTDDDMGLLTMMQTPHYDCGLGTDNIAHQTYVAMHTPAPWMTFIYLMIKATNVSNDEEIGLMIRDDDLNETK